MASLGEVIYEDYLFKFTGQTRSFFWGKSSPWKLKYFSLKRVGTKPVLEYFNKKPKNINTAPKGKLELWPNFRVEKVTNMKNRAYVFQITTPDTTICLSSDEQRTMDIFVFFLQIQTRLKDQIKDDYFPVLPENSEAQRRIGARGHDCILHISPYGVTLALQSNRSVLAQWPLKCIRSYESSERGNQIAFEAGRVAPMGDGLYLFQTEQDGNNQIYDLLDRYVLDAVEQSLPNRRGGPEEIEDYVIEAEKLLALTVVCACTADNSDIRNILQSNWSTDIPTHHNSAYPQQMVHKRLTSTLSLSSQNSHSSITTSQSVPSNIRHVCNLVSNTPQTAWLMPQVNQNYSTMPDSNLGAYWNNLTERPPAPPPMDAQKSHGQSKKEAYLTMNCNMKTESITMSPMSPSSKEWAPSPPIRSPMIPTSIDSPSQPTVRDAYKHQFTCPNGAYSSDSYLHPSPDTVVSATCNKSGNLIDQYLTPVSYTENSIDRSNIDVVRPKCLGGRASKIRSDGKNNKTKQMELTTSIRSEANFNVPPDTKLRPLRRMKSVSCEDLSDYLRSVVYEPESKDNDLLNSSDNKSADEEVILEPFPRLQTFSGILERSVDHGFDSYYNIEGRKGTVYDAPGATVSAIRKRFSQMSRSWFRRAVSNPNFIGVLSHDKLQSARVSIGLTNEPDNCKTSLKNLVSENLRRHLIKDSIHKGSFASEVASSKSSSQASSRVSSTHSSPHSSLGRKGKHVPKDDIVATTHVKGINLSKRSRSFRKQQPVKIEADVITEN